MAAWLGTLIVVAHAVIAWLHGEAHRKLGVGLETWQRWYVNIVILGAPLVATVLLWSRYRRCGFGLLAISMAGALVFGGYFHYIGVSPDHVSHLPSGEAQGAFQSTALLLLVTEAAGICVGIWGYVQNRRKSETPDL